MQSPLLDLIEIYVDEAIIEQQTLNSCYCVFQNNQTIDLKTNEQEMNKRRNYAINTIKMMIENKIDFNQGRMIVFQCIGATYPADKIISILTVSNNPIQLSDSNQKHTLNRHWTNKEDERLINGIHRYGLRNWGKVSLFVGNGRNKTQCSNRWSRVLDPKISKKSWTEQEDQQLLKLVDVYGNNNWFTIAYLLGNRSEVQCRFHYCQLMKRNIYINAETNTEITSHDNSSITYQKEIEKPVLENEYTIENQSMTIQGDSIAANNESNSQNQTFNSNFDLDFDCDCDCDWDWDCDCDTKLNFDWDSLANNVNEDFK